MVYDNVVFDVDGVLSDSLGPHYQFCLDLAGKLGIELPERTPKEIADNPMDNLLRRAGFPEGIIPVALEHYKKLFGNYRVRLFEGVPRMLFNLVGYKDSLNIVSSNRFCNVERVVGDFFPLFSRILTLDTHDSKGAALREIKDSAGGSVVYVGDTLEDHMAACESGIPFIRISYGWGIDGEEGMFPVASSVGELQRLLLEEE
ncbi:MAG: HAD hydrolase-like protein [Candidatus Woesearchaeota archaeon]